MQRDHQRHPMTFDPTPPTTGRGSLAVLCALALLIGGVHAMTPAWAYDATVSASPSAYEIGYGQPLTFDVLVLEHGAAVVGAHVTLVRALADGTTSEVVSGYTAANGTTVLVDHPTRSATYTVHTATQESGPVQSSVMPIAVTFDASLAALPTAVPPGGRVQLTGTVPYVAGVPVTIHERRDAGDWRLVGSIPVATDGSFVLSLATDRPVGSYTYRATYAGDGSFPEAQAQATTSVTVTGSGSASAWRALYGTKRRPFTWRSCTLRYQVNVKHLPVTGLSDVKEALRRISQVTGITFRYRGTTTAMPDLDRPAYPGKNRFVVAWSTDRNDLVGLAGVANTMAVNGRLRSGFVLINDEWSREATSGFGAGETRGIVLMHEFGHLIGLDHVRDRRQVMRPGAQPAAVWGAGDLTGLRRIGKVMGCR
jgi:hypothetical protein